MLVYTLTELLIYWNIYLQSMLGKNNKIIRGLLNNVTLSAVHKPTPLITDSRHNLRTKATLTANILYPKPSKLDLYLI